MTEPRRIQLKRQKGWRKPKDAITVARPTRWGNPFKVKAHHVGWRGTRLYEWNVIEDEHALATCMTKQRAATVAVDLFREWLLSQPRLHGDAIYTLHGRDLACWCDLSSPCHADVLLEVANPKGIVTLAPGVECWTKRMAGTPTLAGTRIPTYVIASYARSQGVEGVLEGWDYLTVEQVEQALAFEAAEVSQRGR